MKRAYQRMKNEAAFGHEECGKEGKRVCALRFIFHGGEVAASCSRSECFVEAALLVRLFLHLHRKFDMINKIGGVLMDPFMMEVAGRVFAVQTLFGSTRAYCADYLTDRVPEFSVVVGRADLIREQKLLDSEADEEGLKRRKFSDMFLERSVIQRRVAAALIGKDTLMLHGSTVAVDGQAYLFTAPCGTGKSTHTRLWREVFGDRAVMVNDDKPFLKMSLDGVLACGSPWTGKHGLGSNVSFPLKGICILSRGSENVIRPLSPEDAADFLRSQCFLPEDSDQVGRALELLERLIRSIPLWLMKCTKGPEAAITAYQAMK